MKKKEGEKWWLGWRVGRLGASRWGGVGDGGLDVDDGCWLSGWIIGWRCGWWGYWG